MLLVTGDQIIGTRSFGALEEFVIVGIFRHLKLPPWRDRIRVVLDELKELLAEALANPQFGTREDFAIFCQNVIADIQPGRFGSSDQKDRALQPFRFYGSRD